MGMFQPSRAIGIPFFEPLENRRLLSVSVKVNFQPPSAAVPAGYVADVGSVYRNQGNGFTYGWDAVNTGYRDRNKTADQRYDTFNHTQAYGARTWSLQVPNGAYTVRLVAGDSSAYNSVYQYNLEGQLALSGTPTTAARWIEAAKTVNVSDGALTLTNAAGAKNNKISFIEVTSVGVPAPTRNLPPRAPLITEPSAEGVVISHADVHMETAPFSDPNPGDTHRSSDWQIRRRDTGEIVWRAEGLTTTAGKVHVHFGDGRFVGSLAGKSELLPNTDYKLRVRHRDASGASNSYSAWSIRNFRTTKVVTPPPTGADWVADQAGYKVEQVPLKYAPGEGALKLVVNIAFVPESLHRTAPGDPLFYVSELYGKVRVVTNDYTVRTFASDLLNYDATGPFPGSGEQGLTGLVIDPNSGDLFASMLYDDNPADTVRNRFPKVTRLRSTDGGLTASSRTDILRMPGEQQGQSHQVSNLSVGPDGKLYVHNGDGLGTPQTALDMNSYRGKVLRVNLDGSAPGDNPFYNAVDGINATDYIYAYGLRNPFGGAWYGGQHYQVENGPGVDRLSKVGRGVSYGWDGTSATMSTHAIYNWSPATAPVNIAFVDGSTFGGSGFAADKWGHAFVTESGPTYATGPQSRGKRISEFVIDGSSTHGALAGSPRTLAHYNGNGKGTAVALAAGRDGLYFSDFYEDDPVNGVFTPTNSGSNILRVVYVGA
jgi:glucose/arabinose dehydrogenase